MDNTELSLPTTAFDALSETDVRQLSFEMFSDCGDDVESLWSRSKVLDRR